MDDKPTTHNREYYDIPMVPPWIWKACAVCVLIFCMYTALRMSRENSKALDSAVGRLRERQDDAFTQQNKKVEDNITGFKQTLAEHIQMVNDKLSRMTTKSDLDTVKRDVASIKRQVKSMSEGAANITATINKTAVVSDGRVDIVNKAIRPCKWAVEQSDGWAVPRIMDGKEVKPTVLSISKEQAGVLVYDTLTHGKYIISPDCIWSTYSVQK